MEITNAETSITETELAEFEAQYGLNLPDAYRRHILSDNGGVPSNSFFFADDEEYAVSSFLSVKHGSNSVNKLLDVLNAAPTRPLGTDFYPFADDMFGNMYCINLVNSQVYLWEHDMEGEPMLLANSFSDFVDGLVEEGEEYEF